MLDLESLFKLNYPMCIICSVHEGCINGCIVNTVFQLTPEPPMVAFSLNKASLTHEFIQASGRFAVSVLAEGVPLSLIKRFGFRSGRQGSKLEHVNYRLGENGSPIILENTASYIVAEVVNSVDVGTHTLFIGRITACEIIDEDKIPMTYTYYRDVKGGRTPRSAATYIDRSKGPKEKPGAMTMKKYRCRLCGYIYDPAVGDPENGVEAGTAFEDLPEEWVCPDCGAGQDEFEPID